MPLVGGTSKGSGSCAEMRENERCTRGDSSASTWRARRAKDASRWVGRGILRVLDELD